MSRRLSQQTHNLYGELLERLLVDAARRTPAKAPGTFVEKRIGGETYVYFQFSEPGGKFRQSYLGKRGPAVEQLIRRYQEDKRPEESERAQIEELCSQILAGGAWSMGPRSARVLKGFAAAGLFEAGAVLIGTHAFGIYGNMLGVRWQAASTRSDDVDLAAISMAAAEGSLNVQAVTALERLEMGFLPVPALDPRKPSASYKVRGQSLRVDFLTPGNEGDPVQLPKLGTAAQPLPRLDYLLDDVQRAAVVDAGGFVVLTPHPARFALHKVMVSADRGAAWQTKARKDLDQARELLEVLEQDRPGDVSAAFAALKKRGYERRFRDGWKRLKTAYPDAKLPEL